MTISSNIPSATQPDSPRPRTIITADPELDDLNSMIRLLLYSNELEIEGLIYASSRYHWKGDGAGTTFFMPDREYSRPQQSWRWERNERFIDDVIDAYAKVHQNLLVHDPRYPYPDTLRAVVREGNVRFEGDIEDESPGSRLIMQALLDERPGPVHLQVWAGTSTIARALLSIEERYRAAPGWEAVHTAVSTKAIITKFDSQDDTYDRYIRPNWPGIRVTDVATWTWGYNARRLVLPEDQHLLEADWMQRHVTSVGPLGALYRTWGDGRRMVHDDPTDYFHLAGHTANQLQELGYQVWTDPQDPGGWISEGDSTNMLNLFANGLRGYEHPSYGGWGGRAARSSEAPHQWSVAQAHDSATEIREAHEYSVTRWFADAQYDFATRLRWTVSPRFAQANHHPSAAIDSELDLSVGVGQTLNLSAALDDPDGDTLSCRWWQYLEAGTNPTYVTIANADTTSPTITIPHDAAPGETVHIILEVHDDADMPLKTYRRVIITVDPASPRTDGSTD